ncbi:MAG: hypothetical protein WAX77_00205 [Methylococcaceae bacterium]
MDTFLTIANDASNLLLSNSSASAFLMLSSALIFWIVLAMIYGSKLGRFRHALNEEILAKTKLTGQLENAEQRVQQAQNEIAQQKEQLAQLNQDKQAESSRANALTEQLTAEQTAHQALQQEFINLNAQLHEQSAVIAELQHTLAVQVEQNGHLNQQLESVQAQADAAKQASSEQIVQLEQQLEQVQTQVNTAQQQAHGNYEKLLQAEQAVQHLTEQLIERDSRNEQSANQQLLEKDALIQQLRETITGQEKQLTQLAQQAKPQAVVVTAPVVAEPSVVVKPVETSQIEAVAVTTVESLKPVEAKGWRGFLGSKTPTDEKPSVVEIVIEPPKAEPEPVVVETPQAVVEEPTKPAATKSWLGFLGNKSTNAPVEPITPEPEVVAIEEETVEKEAEEIVVRNYAPSVGEEIAQIKGQLKGWYGKMLGK